MNDCGSLKAKSAARPLRLNRKSVREHQNNGRQAMETVENLSAVGATVNEFFAGMHNRATNGEDANQSLQRGTRLKQPDCLD
jgi:hypothetical protein